MGLPVEINPLLISSSGYVVGRSLRFRSSASAYLSRTPASAGNRTTWTWSAWVKRGILGTSNQSLFSADTNSGAGNSSSYIWFTSSDTLAISIAAGTYYLNSSSVYRDPSAWYHIVVAYDTTQATASNRLKLYVNGVQLTAFGTATYPTQNYTSNINNNVLHSLSARVYQSPTIDTYTDCYLAEINFIDGQALTPSSFGAYDTNGVWQPIKYTGTYGTNGFYLPFSNTTSTTTLVQDSSGNGNNWTANNISLTAGTTYDSMIDSPTNSASSSNYAVLNPLVKTDSGSANSLSEGNLRVNCTSNSYGDTSFATIPVSSGKWYAEFTLSNSSYPSIEIFNMNYPPNFGSSGNGRASLSPYGYGYVYNGTKQNNGSASAYGSSLVVGDVVGIALDMDNGKVWFSKNGTWQASGDPAAGTNAAFTGLSGNFAIGFCDSQTVSYSRANFGQRPFTYTPPSGYKALNTYNLPAPSIANGAQYMAATTFTGNASTNTINNGTNTTIGTSFQPDMVWLKSRSNANNHTLYDSIRGINDILYPNLTNAAVNSANNLTSFNSNGYTLGANENSNDNSGESSVGWSWKAGGIGVTNNSGSITSTVSANTTAGFSVVTYTGTGANATVGHGLGVAPSMIIIKNRTLGTENWAVYHTSTGAAYWLLLSGTNAAINNTTIWQNTSPTSSVFSLGPISNSNVSGSNFVAYCFAAIKGYSAFGSYTGNGSTDGPFVYTGFRPRFIMAKNATTGGAAYDWDMVDTSRNPYNPGSQLADLAANLSRAEQTIGGTNLDILSNGFKMRSTDGVMNGNGNTIIYAAFAENPFNYSRAR